MTTTDLDLPLTLPASQDDLISYGRNCLHIGKIATEQFGRACQALIDGRGSWNQISVAKAMGCAQSTVNDALKLIGRTKIRDYRAPITGDHELPEAEPEGPFDAEIVEDEEHPVTADASEQDLGCPVDIGKDVNALRGVLNAYLLDCDKASAARIVRLLKTYQEKFVKIKEGS